ncbi:MAG TPA: hypothetical protein PKA56_11225 [Solirubrobacterales bacterium]|nr:hypothetical protein [Solirubrobacterales bacterium]HMW46193.1 hypothetical protein [Solirubrobacterales bacterium]HMX72308.1 hypothetical protein [Solirubrobacterales bacterium]HNA23105.1 hypothetical protein [Solirubrobacterales bacterium]HNC05201.1 hypothetical protein [Solirubrobacterales bacterium]
MSTESVSNEQIYRLRAAASGREAIAPVKDGVVYRDAETGEELEPVAAVLPNTGEGSSLPRTPVNLRVCRRCEQLTPRDLDTCEFCGLPAS